MGGMGGNSLILNNTAEYSQRAEKRLKNMKAHARMLGKDSSWLNEPKYGEEYRNILKEQKIIRKLKVN